jgi:uncharacterized repeat protein (TIGR03847 family)
MLIELDPVDHVTADAVGPPGDRTFYLQARKGDHVVTILVEKQQVQLLAASVVEILARVGKETGQGPPEEQMGLDEPLLPEWRAGRLSIGYQEDRDLLMLEAEELLPEEEEAEAEGTEESPPEGLDVFGPELTLEAEEESFEAGEELGEDVGEDAAVQAVEEALGLEPAPETSRVRFWATREQMLSLARHGALVCASGRPQCPLCGNPMDPQGHRCPALNGHRKLGGE